MKIGVIVPVRNALGTIETCLDSLRAQDYAPGWFGSYLVDDASSDGTAEFLQNRPSWYAQLEQLPERVGWPAALNRAAELAIADGCDVLFTMNADDWLRLDCLRRCASALWFHGADFVVPAVQQVGEANVKQVSLPAADLSDFRENTPYVAFCLIRASVWRAVGGYHLDVNLPAANDPPGYAPMAGLNELDFYIRLFKAGYRGYSMSDDPPLVYYRMHASQLHRQVIRRRTEALALIHKKHPEVLGQEESR